MRVLRLVLVLSLVAWMAMARAAPLRIAAAADLRFVLDAITAELNLDADLDIVYGSSGKLTRQIEQGAPFALFFSADEELAQRLHRGGWSTQAPVVYALGRLVVWRAPGHGTAMSLEMLADPAIRRIAIANPAHAPYGQRAMEAIRAAGLEETLQPKLVFGENVAQAAQMVASGAADAGLIAASLLSGLPEPGSALVVDSSLHAPIRQAYVLAARYRNDPLLARLLAHIASAPGRNTLNRFGFESP